MVAEKALIPTIRESFESKGFEVRDSLAANRGYSDIYCRSKNDPSLIMRVIGVDEQSTMPSAAEAQSLVDACKTENVNLLQIISVKPFSPELTTLAQQESTLSLIDQAGIAQALGGDAGAQAQQPADDKSAHHETPNQFAQSAEGAPGGSSLFAELGKPPSNTGLGGGAAAASPDTNSLFGAKPAPPAAEEAKPAAPAAGGGLFGGGTATPAPAAEEAKPAAPAAGGGLFGGGTATPAPAAEEAKPAAPAAGGGLFGGGTATPAPAAEEAKPAAPAAGGGLFGGGTATPAPAAEETKPAAGGDGSSLFGASPAATANNDAGGNSSDEPLFTPKPLVEAPAEGDNTDAAAAPTTDLAAPAPPDLGAAPMMGGTKAPHRGQTVLILGIVGIFVWFIPPIIAWIMGAKDLKKMDNGQMDPEGRKKTKIGKTLGMIFAILQILAVVGGIASMAFGLVGAANALQGAGFEIQTGPSASGF